MYLLFCQIMNEGTKVYRFLYPHSLPGKVINTQSITADFYVNCNDNNDILLLPSTQNFVALLYR